MRPATSAAQDPKIRELSGRSRAILKQYFDDDASTITFPLGHRTVAFTEPQIYHLLRVLTDETLKMFYSTMEQMVIGAVRGPLLHLALELTTSRSDQGLKLPAQGCKVIRKIVRGLSTVPDQGLTPLKDPVLAKKVGGQNLSTKLTVLVRWHSSRRLSRNLSAAFYLPELTLPKQVLSPLSNPASTPHSPSRPQHNL